jgi:two-component system nitrate/nitrite response regulator NarL
MGEEPTEQPAPPRIDVELVDDQALFADTMAWALTRRGFNLVAVVNSGAAALSAAREHRPHLVILDVGLPDMSGLEVGRTILRELPGVKVVALTGLDSWATLQEAMGIGFHGYISKNTPVSRFADMLRGVLSGDVVVSRIPPGELPPRPSQDEQQALLLASQLTLRERDVLALLGTGAQTEEIAARLHISANTVRTHVQSILLKLNLHSRLEAIAFGYKYKLIPPPEDRSA